jgi:hypothetical protein
MTSHTTTQVKVLYDRETPSLVVPAATLSGLMPSAYKDSLVVKDV